MELTAAIMVMSLSIDRAILPEINPITVDVPRKTGLYIPINNSRIINAAKFKITFGILGNNPTDLRAKSRLIAAWLFNANKDGTAKPFILSDEPTKIYQVWFSGSSDLEEIAAIGEVSLDFIAPDPFAAANVERSQLFTAGSITITNNGTAEAYPVYRIVPTGAMADFTLTAAGNTMYFSRAFANGETFIIDTKKAEAYLEGSGYSILPYMAITSRFMPLQPGQSYTITAAPAGSLSARITFTERFL